MLIINWKKNWLETYFSLADEGANVDKIEMELLSLRIQRLLDEREVLVNDAYLRKNPNNVYFWEKRLTLFGGEKDKLIEICQNAIARVNPRRAVGNFANIWIQFATFHLSNGIDKAREIFEKAVKVDFKSVEELAQVFIAYADMEMTHEKSLHTAIEILNKATTPIKRPALRDESTVLNEFTFGQINIHKNMTLWSFFLDVLEMDGNVNFVSSAYDRVIELKICTVQTIVNYAYFLERNNLFEESFRVYERGIDLFRYPVAFELWNIFLPKFIAFYKGTKLERIRDLFEQALEECPPNFAAYLYVYYGKIEEEFGLTRNAMRIYDRAAKAVPIKDRKEMFLYYIGRAADLYGITATREVFEMAIASLPDNQVREVCLLYSQVEAKLGEIERARVLYIHGAQFANPTTEPEYWETWNKFELENGNQDTFREMLRIKRAVETKYSSMVVIQRPAMLDAPEFVSAKSHTNQ